MLTKGGNPREVYYCKNLLKEVDCWDIAEFFRADNVLLALKDVEKYFPRTHDNAGVH